MLIVVTDINSDEEEDDQSRTRDRIGEEWRLGAFAIILCTFYSSSQQSKYLGIKISNIVRC